MILPEGFQQLLAESVGGELAERTLSALEAQPSVSVRLNPAKLLDCPFPDATPVAWSPFGYLLPERPVFTLDPLFHAGCYYVQDSSAMYVGHVFRQVSAYLQPGAQVLDLCAAPGGKTTDLAASLRERFGNRFKLLANEVMRNRFSLLRQNVETWGDPCVDTVSRDPSAFGDEPAFDLILADVPCSGEGMFRKDAQAVADWSPAAVEFCAARSRRILRDIWPTLRPGGVLVFSTCTFNHLENDDTVAWVAAELGADVLPLPAFPPVVNTDCGQLLLPGLVPGEGQYVAALRKHGEYAGESMFSGAKYKADAPENTTPGRQENRDGRCVSRSIGPHFSDGKRNSVPVEAEAPLVNVDRQTALQYLHGDAVVLPEGAPLGPVTIAYEGHALGPGKNLGRRCNNLYPKNKRIRMDIR